MCVCFSLKEREERAIKIIGELCFRTQDFPHNFTVCRSEFNYIEREDTSGVFKIFILGMGITGNAHSFINSRGKYLARTNNRA